MAASSGLSPAKVVLLAAQFAAGTDISALRQLTALHPTVLNLVLSLRILLSFLPESTDPRLYIPYIQDLSKETFSELDGADFEVSAVQKLTDTEARKRVRKLRVLPLEYTGASHDLQGDALTLFFINRAHKIDAETGLLPLLPSLLEPFLDHSEYIRTWLISTLLPLLRLNYEYYPNDEPKFSLESFERLGENVGASLLLSKAGQKHRSQESSDDTVGRDLRGLVGPWMYGRNRAKRRKIIDRHRRTSVVIRLEELRSNGDTVPQHDTEDLNDWQPVYDWLLSEAAEDFAIAVQAVEHWDGPGDVDYANYDDGHQHLDETTLQRLEAQYAQATLAAIYSTKDSSLKALRGAHRILVRVSELLNLPQPADLDTSVDLLPGVVLSPSFLETLSSTHLVYNALLLPSNPLTRPNGQSLSLLFTLLISTFTLTRLGASLSVKRVAEIYLSGDKQFQRLELQRAVRSLVSAARKDDKQWMNIRTSLLWLWSWGREPQAGGSIDGDKLPHGAGVFGKVEKVFLEKELLRAFLNALRMSAPYLILS